MTIVLLLLLGICALFIAHVRSETVAVVRISQGFVLTGLLVGYLILNSSWSLDPAAGYEKIAAILIIGACCLAALKAIQCLDSNTLRLTAKAILIAFAVGALALMIELVSGLRVTRAIYNVMPFVRPESVKHLGLEDDRVVYIGTYVLNRNVGALALMLWPAAMLLKGQLSTARSWIAPALLLFSVVVVAISQHQTSQIAVLFGAATLAASWFFATGVRRLLSVLWCAAFLFVIPMSSIAYHYFGLHRAPWLPYTAQARIIIWSYTADHVPDNLWLGVGLRSTRKLDKDVGEMGEKPAGHVVMPRTGRHAHNLFLQTWFELGLVGVVLVILSGLSVLGLLANAPQSTRPYGYGLFAASMVVAAFSWGMWQTWLLALFALVSVFFGVGWIIAKRRHPSRSQQPMTSADTTCS